MALEIEVALVRASAPSNLADVIIGDLHEKHSSRARTLGEAQALASAREEILRSLPALLTYRASRAVVNNWALALAVAGAICTFCVATIPLWGHIGMAGSAYHLLRVAIIGLVLGCCPRASTLSCIFLLLLIGVSDLTIDAREGTAGWHTLAEIKNYVFVLQDGAIMASMLIALRIVRLIRAPSAQ